MNEAYRRLLPAMIGAVVLPVAVVGIGLATAPAAGADTLRQPAAGAARQPAASAAMAPAPGAVIASAAVATTVAGPTPTTASPSTPIPTGPPPSAPTDLTAAQVRTDLITLAWTASTPGCCAIAGYQITYGQAFDDVLHASDVGNATAATFSARRTTQYQFSIRAKDVQGHYSAPTSITVMTPAVDTGDTVPPAAPEDLTSDNGTLSWSPSTDNVGVTGYDVYRFDGWFSSVLLATVPTTSFTLPPSATTPPPSGLRNLFYVRARDAAGNLSIASNTVAPSGTPPTPTCAVTYQNQSEWADGFVAAVTVQNTGQAPLDGWTLSFSFPGDQQITSGWNATYTQSGASVTVRNATWNGSVPPGGDVSFGFQGRWTASNVAPMSFVLNSAPCTIG